MKTAVIIVLFNTPESQILSLKNEIANLGLPSVQSYFIDNTDTGRGYAQGVNEGIRQALSGGCSYFLVCNPDISLASLQGHVLDASGKFDIWGFGMRQSNRTYYGGEIDPWRMSANLTTQKPDKRFYETEYVTGSCMALSKKAIECIGYFDESYFMYYEDVDYCMRANRAGLRVGIDAGVHYDHFETSDSNPQKKYLLARNRLKFLNKYGDMRIKLREAIRIPLTVFQERSLIAGMVFNSPFIKNFLSLNASGIIGKALSFILFLFLVRYIPVAQYGLYTLVWAHVTLLSPLVDFGTTSYGMLYLPREKEDRTVSLFSLRLVLSVLVYIATVAFAYIIGFKIPVTMYVILVSFVVFYNMTSGMYFILTSIKEEMVKTSVISTMTNALMILVLVATVFFTKSISYVFFAIGFFYILYSVLYLSLIKGMVKGLAFRFNPKDWLTIIGKSYVFVLISLFAGIYFKIDVYVLNMIKGTEAVGVYSSGYKFFEAMIMFASTYNTLSAPSFSKTAFRDKSKLKGKVIRHLLFLGIIGLIIVASTYLFGSLFLPFILKGNYALAIDVVMIVVWALPFILFSSVFLNLLYASELPRVAIIMFIATSFINASLNLIFVPHFSYIASSYITVASEVINLLFLAFAVFFVYKKRIFND